MFYLDGSQSPCTPSCCIYPGSCSNQTVIDGEVIPSWTFGRCGGPDFTTFLCLDAGAHTIETEWSCKLIPGSRIEIFYSTSHCNCSTGGSCTKW